MTSISLPSGKISEALDSCICLLETMAESALARDDHAEWAMMSVMAANCRETITAALSVPAPGTGGAEPVAWRRMNKQRTQSTAVTDVKPFADQWAKAGDVVEPLYSTPQGGDLGAGKVIDAWAHFHDGKLLSVTLRKETADAYRKNGLDVRQLAALSSTPVGEMDGWQTMDSAPHACHVLATRFDSEFGEWVYAVVMSPPSPPFTHWRPLPASPQGGR